MKGWIASFAFGAALVLGGCKALIAVYDDDGINHESATASVRMFEWMGYEVERLQAEDIRNGKLSRYSVMCLPDGDPREYSQKLTPPGFKRIIDFVRNGGGVIGIDGGASFLSEGVFYYRRKIPVETLSMFPGFAATPGLAVSATPRDSGITINHKRGELRPAMSKIAIKDGTHPITRDGAESFTARHWNESPAFFLNRTKNATVLATYEETGQAAMVAFEYGQGRAFVIGVHPEIEEYDNRDGLHPAEELRDPDSEWDLMQSATAWVQKGDRSSPDRRSIICVAALLAYAAGMTIIIAARKAGYRKKAAHANKPPVAAQEPNPTGRQNAFEKGFGFLQPPKDTPDLKESAGNRA